MKTEHVLFIGIAALLAAGLVIAFVSYGKNVPDASVNTLPDVAENGNTAAYKTIVTGSTDSGDVSVELTPHKVTNGQLRVDIAANTHSVELSQFDLGQITTLEYNGKSVPPVSAPAISGHHSSGTLVFDVGEDISAFTIKILGIPQVEERVFSWNP